MSDEQTTGEIQPDSNQELGNRPEWLPEKFKSPEDLARSYAELEKKLGARTTSDVSIEREGSADTWVPKEVDEVLTSADLSFDDIEDAVRRNGKPLEAQYKALAKAGMSRSAVDRMIRAETIMRDSTVRAASEAAGGKENLSQLIEWAGSKDSGLTDAEIETFNKAVGRGGSPDLAESQVKYLRWRFEQAGGGTNDSPGLVTGSPSTGAGGFKNNAEYGKAVMDMYNGKLSAEEFARRDRMTPESVKVQPGVRSR